MKTEYPTVYMPSTGRPAPPLLTEDEAIELLRIDQSDVADPRQSLRRYRERYPGIIRPVQISKRLCYPLVNLLEVINKLSDLNPH